MTVKTTISFTDRHDRYLKDKVGGENLRFNLGRSISSGGTGDRG